MSTYIDPTPVKLSSIGALISNIPTMTNVAVSTITGVLQAANPDRKELIFFNDSISRCKVALDATASATHCSFAVAAGQTISLSGVFSTIYTGVVAGIWDSPDASGAMRLTELS